jgi:MerR family transcriptional regulator, redox-sensitive transcriptional activator SoxR
VEQLSIGEVAARSGLAASALRFYEDQGLISAGRTTGGARRYPRSVLRRLAVIRAGRNVGLSLPEIREALDTLPGERPPTATDWARLSSGWRDRLDEQIAALEQLRDGLTSCIGCGCLSLDRCALSNLGDVAGRDGAGARWLRPALRRTPPG